MGQIREARGKVLERMPNAVIFEGFPYNRYDVSRPRLSERDEKLASLLIKVISRASSLNSLLAALGKKNTKLVEGFRNTVIRYIDVNELLQRIPEAKQLEHLKKELTAVAESLGVSSKEEFVSLVLDQTVGYGSLSVLMSDPNLEDIMVNGFERNVFVFHRRFGNCKTNILVDRKSGILSFIKRISATVRKQFTEAHPLLDARLPDGSRANATFSYVSPFGHTLTIRKFSKIPLSIVDLMANNTLTSEAASFLWTMVQGLGAYSMNTIITGGTGSGKTTLMNVLASFIPFEERIISIEDTLELDLGGRENWIQMESKPKIKDILPVSMDDLLKNTLRMRPDRIVVGEVRGVEAETLFVAMDTGHDGILGTLHSNSAREMMLRLKNPPMNVPEQMLPLLDLVVVMQRHYDKQKGMLRRVKQVAEIGRMDEKVLLNNVFELNRKKDVVEKTNVPSSLVEKLAQARGIGKNELKRELLVRSRILEYLLEKGIRDRAQVESIIQQYYYSPESVLKKITEQEQTG